MGAYLFLAVFGLLTAIFFTAVFVWRFTSYRGRRVIVCPETHQPAGVELNAALAARTRGVDGEAVLRLKNCSRWPEKADCDQGCVAQIESSPEGTLMRNILASWFAGKVCTFCHRAIPPVAWHDEMPALRAPDGLIREWENVSAEDLPAMLQTHQPVCWNCSLTEGFRREHPNLVVDRADSPLRDRLYH